MPAPRESTAARPQAKSGESDPTAPTAPPLFVPEDFTWFAYAYPLRWLVAICPPAIANLVERGTRALYPLLLRKRFAQLQSRMAFLLGVERKEARRMARGYVTNALRGLFCDLRRFAGREMGLRFHVTGEEHLQTALRAGAGVLVISTHSVAMRTVKVELASRGLRMWTVRAAYPAGRHGRLWRKWAMGKQEAIDARLHARIIDARAPDTTLQIAGILRGGGIVSITPDVRFSASSVPVALVAARWMVGTGILQVARMCRCPVIPMQSALAGEEARVDFGEPLPIDFDVPADRFVTAHLPLLVAEIERQIRTAPDQWSMWLAPRFEETTGMPE